MSSGHESGSSGNNSSGGTQQTITDGHDPVAVMRAFRACCELARREASGSAFALANAALGRAEERLNQFSLNDLASAVTQSEERQDAVVRLRDACSRASRKLQKLPTVSAMKRAFGYTTNVRDAVALLAKQASAVADLLGEPPGGSTDAESGGHGGLTSGHTSSESEGSASDQQRATPAREPARQSLRDSPSVVGGVGEEGEKEAAATEVTTAAGPAVPTRRDSGESVTGVVHPDFRPGVSSIRPGKFATASNNYATPGADRADRSSDQTDGPSASSGSGGESTGDQGRRRSDSAGSTRDSIASGTSAAGGDAQTVSARVDAAAPGRRWVNDAKGVKGADAAAAETAFAAAQDALARGDLHGCVAHLTHAADVGHGAAAAQLAPMLAAGEGRAADSQRATAYYKMAAEAGDALSQNEWGVALLAGDIELTGVSQDLAGAARWFAEAGARGASSGDYNLGGCYERGAGVVRDVTKAYNLYHRALSRGCYKAHAALGYLALHREDYPAAAEHFGAIAAAHAAGVLQNAGMGRLDAADALYCLAHVYERAATLGRERARIAELAPGGAIDLVTGSEVVADVATDADVDAEDADMVAAASRKREAAVKAAAMLDVTRPDDAPSTAAAAPKSTLELRAEIDGDAAAAVAEAAVLYWRSADLGDPRAMLRRGLEMWRRALADHGGETTDAGIDARETALSWVVRAADAGHGPAWRFLGDVARDGSGGGEPDLLLAKSLYLRAHECRDAEGTQRLAAAEEAEWKAAAAIGEINLLPTKPPVAWKRTPPQWVYGVNRD